MRSKNGIIAIGSIGVIIIAFTLAVFFLREIERIPVNNWALAFLLLSEAVLFGGLIGLRLIGTRHNKAFLRAGVASSLSLYFAATLISTLFAGMFRENLNTFILIQLAIVAMFAIVTIAVFASSRGIERHNQEDIHKVGTKEAKRGGF